VAAPSPRLRLICCHDEGGCNESTRFTDGSGVVSPHRRGLRTNLGTVRQGQSSASAAGCYQRLVRAIGGTGHCAGPFLFGGVRLTAAAASRYSPRPADRRLIPCYTLISYAVARQSADADEWHRAIRDAVPVRFWPNGVRQVHATAGREAA